MQTKRLVAFVIPVLAFAGSFLAPPIAEAMLPTSPKYEVWLLAFSIATSVMYAGSAILFAAGLKSFTAKLKIAYGVFCAALIIFALAELQVPIGQLSGLMGSTWLAGGGVIIPILFAIGGMYAGIKLFANLYEVKGLCSKPWLVAITAIIVSVLAFMLPTGPSAHPYDAKGNVALMAMALVLFASSATLLWQIKKKATQTYVVAMTWFFLAMLSFVAVTIITMGMVITIGTIHPAMLGGGSVLAQALLALFLLKAAHEFNVLGVAIVGEGKQTPDNTTATVSRAGIVDVILVTAQKASNATAIDPWLDNLRAVTSRSAPGQPLSQEDQSLLENTYQELERYLVEDEPVRRYSKDELRQLIRKELRVSGPIFFDKL